ncbi:hypothetical protein GCM10023168_26800 [Fodinibacter luteus]|uniref:Uncharacterized protein n=1 Tax=Fodinibacter luteus TaxID=552064 RepID=A0ABP8KKP5_9MICO
MPSPDDLMNEHRGSHAGVEDDTAGVYAVVAQLPHDLFASPIVAE